MYHLRAITDKAFETSHKTYSAEDAWKFMLSACHRNHDYILLHDNTTKDFMYLFYVDNACCYSGLYFNYADMKFKIIKDIVITT